MKITASEAAIYVIIASQADPAQFQDREKALIYKARAALTDHGHGHYSLEDLSVVQD